MPTVTIFGGSQTNPGERGYEDARRLGFLLAQAGWSVMTGGYMGTMEAASRGANEAGGQVIGVTCDEIEAFRPVGHNAWVKEERRYTTLRERIYALITAGDAALALPGGPGTLAEVSSMWNHLLIGAIAPRPLILIGPDWQETIQLFVQNFSTYIPAVHQRWLQYAADVDTAVNLLQPYLKNLTFSDLS